MSLSLFALVTRRIDRCWFAGQWRPNRTLPSIHPSFLSILSLSLALPFPSLPIPPSHPFHPTILPSIFPSIHPSIHPLLSSCRLPIPSPRFSPFHFHILPWSSFYPSSVLLFLFFLVPHAPPFCHTLLIPIPFFLLFASFSIIVTMSPSPPFPPTCALLFCFLLRWRCSVVFFLDVPPCAPSSFARLFTPPLLPLLVTLLPCFPPRVPSIGPLFPQCHPFSLFSTLLSFSFFWRRDETRRCAHSRHPSITHIHNNNYLSIST